MGNAEQGLRLLLARDAAEARDLAQSLEDDNQRRRRYDEEALAEAAQRVERELGWPDCSSILLWSERWHAGVIGIVASRLVERFQRPAVLVALGRRARPRLGPQPAGARPERGAGGVRRPARSATAGTPSRRGSPCTARGCPSCASGSSAWCASGSRPTRACRGSTIDADVTLAECDLGLVDWLERMSPHGLDNPEPLFQADGPDGGLGATTVAQGRHLRLQVRDGTGSAEAIGFGLGARADEVRRARRCDAGLRAHAATSGWGRPACSSR